MFVPSHHVCPLFPCIATHHFTAESEAEAHSKPFVASMGMYVFKKDVLQELLLKRFPKVGI